MINKTIICDCCSKERGWDSAYPGGEPENYFIHLPKIRWQNLCTECIAEIAKRLENI
ncbi:hypothetical protein ES708_08010 [subsurface metagenome]